MKRNLQPEFKAAIDTRLEDAVSKANYRITLNNQIQNARMKAEKGLTYSLNGGIFKITPELISFTQTLLALEQNDVILVDINKNPIEVKDLKKFQQEIVDRYYETMNEFLAEFTAVRQKRTTEALIKE